MILGEKIKVNHPLGSKLSVTQMVGSKIKSMAINHLIHKLAKKEENVKSFLEKR